MFPPPLNSYQRRGYYGDEPFAVLLSDDVIPPGETLLRDMLGLFEELGAPVVALMRVPREEISKYGVIGGEDRKPGVFRIKDLVEKPSPEDAPSELAVIGRYILTPDIFEVLGSLPPGRGGEIQLTDAIKVLAERRPVYGMVFEGKRYDAGSKLGFLKATVDFALQDEELSGEFGKYIQEAASRIKG
ncbi:MAG: sugar phosphate nucleotidyltransferase [Nitrospirota bacterium]